VLLWDIHYTTQSPTTTFHRYNIDMLIYNTYRHNPKDALLLPETRGLPQLGGVLWG